MNLITRQRAELFKIEKKIKLGAFFNKTNPVKFKISLNFNFVLKLMIGFEVLFSIISK